ncbi:MAG: WbuC family cupin fold metalloprotein [Gammaproteobacteria bacterium]|nr:WbuC family cupin fold metalloprotein [Gammaproteobacteria bacterium]
MSELKTVDHKLCAELLAAAADSPRLRSHKNMHARLDEPVQRLLIALQRGTYVQPHRHPQAHKWELILAVQAETLLLLFDDDGKVTERFVLSPANSPLALELPSKIWHTVLPLQQTSVILEVKQGPFDPREGADFAPWAPQEGEPAVADFLLWAQQAELGGRYDSGWRG